MSAPVTHIAANEVMIGGQLLRQRCAWCGAVLIDYDLARVAVAAGEGGPATWPVGRLVRVDGPCSTALDEADELPDDACARLDDDVTGADRDGALFRAGREQGYQEGCRDMAERYGDA